MTETRMRFRIEIDEELCKGCQLCIEACPKDVIELGHKFNVKGWRYAEPKPESNCIGCKQCAIVCPDVAIRVIRED